MAVEHVANTRSNLASQILTDLGSSAQLTLRTSIDGELATLTITGTTGTVAGAVLTFSTFNDETSANAGECDHLQMETTGGTEIFSFNASGDGVTLSSTTIGGGDTVKCTGLSYTAPP